MACSLAFIEFFLRANSPCWRHQIQKNVWRLYDICNEKPVIIACDNIASVKQHKAIEALMVGAEKGFPYDGAKEHYILDVSKADNAVRVVTILAEVLPYPKKEISKRMRHNQ